MLSRRGFIPILLILIIICATASMLLTALAQTDIYLGLPPTPPTKRILYNWNESACWTCHYIPAPMPPEAPKILYTQKVSISFEAEPGLRRLTAGPGNNKGTVWSPDGRKIAYVSDRFGNWTLYVLDLDSGKETQLTSPDSISGWADWSPDGNSIAFWSYRDGQSQIHNINNDGTNQRQLTTNPFPKSEPHWSPDGKMILFGQKDKYWQIWVMDVVTSRQRRVSGAGEQNNHWAPIWMPNGKEILYYASDGLVLRAVDVESGHHRELTFASLKNLPADLHPRISPDRTKILFNSLRSKNWGLWLMDMDGRNTKKLTEDGAGDRSASWRPDGKKILYYSYRTGNPSIWLMNSDGSNQTQLTKGRFDDFYPSWSASGERIAFESNREGKFDIWLLELNRPLETSVTFSGHPHQNSSSEAKLTFTSRTEGKLQVEAVRLHFDWDPADVYERLVLAPPVMLSPPSTTEAQTVTFKIPSNAMIGYHLYDLTAEFRQVIDGSPGPLRTYQHTAKDLDVASQERGLYDTFHNKVASEIEIQNTRARKEGYSELLVKANQELQTAERLAREGKITEASEHLRISENYLQQNTPEERPAQPPMMEGVTAAIIFLIVIAAYVVRRKLGRPSSSMNAEKS